MGDHEISLPETLGRLKSSGERERAKAVQDIKQIFRHNEHSQRIDNLSDKAWHNLFEALFECTKTERATYLRHLKRAKARSSSESETRLESCASTLRAVVEVGAAKLRSKTVRALLDHITHTLPSTDGYITPLSINYLKALRTVFEYPPHVEHLREYRKDSSTEFQEWSEMVTFCADAINFYCGQADSGASDTTQSAGRSALRTPFTSADFSAKTNVAESASKGAHSSRSAVQLEELVSCLRCLAHSTNAPVFKKAPSITNALVLFLQTARSVGRAHRDAISAINAALVRAVPQSIRVTQVALQQIIPLLKDLWMFKSATFKDEMLASLVLTRSHVFQMLKDPSEADFRVAVESLLEVLVLDYCRRLEREQLALDDVTLVGRSSREVDSTPLSKASFRLRSGNVRAEPPWTQIDLIALYATALDKLKKPQAKEANQDAETEEAPAKRARTSSQLDDFLRQAVHSSGLSKLGSLQILSFMMQSAEFDALELEKVIDHLTRLLTTDKGSVSSWTALVLTSCAFQRSSADESLRPIWEKAAQLSTKLVSSTSTCRAACHLLDTIIQFQLISPATCSAVVDNILSSSDLGGFPVFAESSMALWSTLLQFKTVENPSSAGVVSERALNWLFSRFSPSKLDEKGNVSQSGLDFDAADIMRLLSRCLNRQLGTVSQSLFQRLGLIGQTWRRTLNFKPVTDYLLLLEDTVSSLRVLSTQTSTSASTTLHARSSASASRLIVDFCNREVNNVIEKWHQLAVERSKSITLVGMRLVALLCLVSDAVAASFDSGSGDDVDGLISSNALLAKEISTFVALKDCDQLKVDVLCEVVARSLPDIKDWNADNNLTGRSARRLSFLLHLSTGFEQRSKAQAKMEAQDVDLMDLDGPFESQASNGHHKSGVNLPPRDLTALTDDNSFRTCVSQYLNLLRSCLEALTVNNSANFVPPDFVQHLTELPPETFCACQPVVELIFSSSLLFPPPSIEGLVDCISESFLEDYTYERNEVALSICVSLLSHFAEQWTDSQNTSLCESARQVYNWFVSVALPNNLCSTDVKQNLIGLFFQLLKARGPEYRGPDNEQSVRTYIFTLLKSSTLLVSHGVSEAIPEFFNYFILGEHENVFGDLYKNISSRSDWLEGMALRLIVLANLGSRWPTLLRRSLYHIFETAGVIEQTSGHARFCVSKIVRSIGLEESRSLFQLFMPQLLYTWLSVQSLATIPFGIFDYQSLEELLRDSQEEAFPQILMRGKDAEMAFLTEALGYSTEDILKSNSTFAKSAAYCLSWDIDAGGAERPTTSENSLSTLIGKEKYIDILKAHLAYTLGTIMSTVEQDQHISKILAKRSNTQAAVAILNEIMKISSSTYALPADQQPCFSAKTLMDRIAHLCHRLGLSETKLWTTPLYVFVLRMLFSKIHPALGSLHACSTIRKIRTLVALAGPVALSGYAIEMALQNLIPFTTDKQCAEDALGIVQYLLHRGMKHLVREISSVTGLVVSALVSLRKFVGSSQDSTTQESQHIATMEKAKAFHVWLSKHWCQEYISELRKQNVKDAALESFTTLVNTATDAQAEASPITGTMEGGLLLHLLEQAGTEKPLLRPSRTDLIIGSFCSQFKPPPSFRNDILGKDDVAEHYAAAIWHSIRIKGADEQYQLWSARALGRAYNASGKSQFLSRSRSRAPSTKSEPVDPDDLAYSSKVVIFECLQDLLTSSNSREAGLTEDTIRIIISRSQKDLADIQRLLPRNVVSAFTLTAADSIEGVLAVSKPLALIEALQSYGKYTIEIWLQVVCISLANKAFPDPVITSLVRFLRGIPGVAERLFTPILHLVLLYEFERKQEARRVISTAFKSLFQDVGTATIPHAKAALQAIIYLRKQAVPNETTDADREQWLDIDHVGAARAAEYCHLHTIALILAETSPIQTNTERGSRRSSAAVQRTVPDDLLLSIYRNIDEPDSFYGVQQDSTLASVLSRLDYEGEGFKSLLFRGAQADSEMRRLHNISASSAGGLITALNYLNLNSLNHALLSKEQFNAAGPNTAEKALDTARKLDQWDIRTSERAASEPSIIYAVLQGISNATTGGDIRRRLDQGFANALSTMTAVDTSPELMRSGLRTLGLLTEIDDVIGSLSMEDLEEALTNMIARGNWMQSAQAKDVRPVISTRQTVFGLLSSHDSLRAMLHLNARDARVMEVKNIMIACSVAKQLQTSQELLASATYLSDIVPRCQSVGVDVAEEAQHLMAEVLWDQGEKSTAIRMLQQLANNYSPVDNASGKASLLAQLGHNVAEARLEQPVDIIDKYLAPAVNELRGQYEVPGAGNVLHEFAAFCDKQLSNREEELDLPRLRKARDQRQKEVQGLEELLKKAKSPEKRRFEHEVGKAKKWFAIENNEYERLRRARQSYLSESLKNYLLSLSCSNDHDNDVLRFFSIWLDFAEDSLANKAVKEAIDKVPSAKFVVLINQLTSRLQTEKTAFQDLLTRLIIRTCVDHPHHAMHNIFAAIQSASTSMDEAAKSRVNASNAIAKALQSHQRASRMWSAIRHADTLYHQLAMLKEDRGVERVQMDKYPQSKAVQQRVKEYKVPPPTLEIPLRTDMDYSEVPIVVGFHPNMRIANGISAPKIVTSLISDGSQFKQLFKGGTDDLRQDMIMEQVFEQASKLLKNHTATRQRNLRIRTYKVLPLSSRSGTMEFVQNTMALHDALMPAHEAYYPKDMKPRAARNKITECDKLGLEVRVKEFKNVCERFHPVMRFFFLERFLDPDEWFEKRLAYTRTTAAISILGHVLGLGDRHLHNILLDEQTGEVVHIDLGVAFEAGRALPIPEVVPFRLTRDIVDGMGINKTEGVFRRCCEFTLEALREERESIMTLLNVLRYDPLYSWTVSPLRAKRMQESDFGASSRDHSRAPSRAPDDGIDGRDVGPRKDENEVGEAERALTVVEKKLSKALSTTATVSELIQQATDERNLAVLFSGWSAYA